MSEYDTGLLVNTSTGVVHKPDCEVVTRTTGRSGPWLAPWKGVAMSPSDKPCGYCKPDLEAARVAAQTAAEKSYDRIYADSESSMFADYVIALDDVWPATMPEPYPSVVAGYIKHLQQVAIGSEPRCRLGNVLKHHTQPCGPGCEYPA